MRLRQSGLDLQKSKLKPVLGFCIYKILILDAFRWSLGSETRGPTSAVG